LFRNHPTLPLGTHGPAWFRRVVALPLHQVKTHLHVIGVSGSGKSRFLAGLYLNLLRRHLPATLIDPHGDLAQLVLAHLVAGGVYRRPDAFARVLYLDIPAAERAGRFLPFNVLAQPYDPYTTARNVKEAFHRAWPSLAGGAAPMFDTLVQDGMKVLISNGLPMTAFYRLLTDQPYRDALLSHEPDPDIVAFFHDQFDRLSAHDRVDQAGAALRRAHLLTFAPVLKYSLGQQRNALSFRDIFDRNQSLIVNLAVADGDARRLLGCLFTVAAEQAALARADRPPAERRGSHHLILDEFAEFSAQSEASLARILSQCRKYGLYVVMAHQTWGQASSTLKNALQNVGLEVAFRLGRADAEHTATVLGRVNPLAVKHQAQDETAQERGHPVFYSLPEQWESWCQQLQDLPPRHAVIKPALGPAIRTQTLPMPDPAVDAGALAEVTREYLRRGFVPRIEVEPQLQQQRTSPPPTSTRRRQGLPAPATRR
jgi:hypothetical protein